MALLIYCPVSHGGSYVYANYVARKYTESTYFTEVALMVPKNSSNQLKGSFSFLPVLLPASSGTTSKIWSKLKFLIRAFANPIILMKFLNKQQKYKYVLFNDFDQFSIPFWVPLLAQLKKKAQLKLGVVLHDPDRTQYPPNKSYSDWCMEQLMQVMDFALYHEQLPNLPYYERFRGIAKAVPHGIFNKPNAKDQSLCKKIADWKKNDFLLSVIGHIRPEKNYDLIISALAQLPGYKLLIAGSASNSEMNTAYLKKQAQELDLNERILWIEKYLTEEELASCIELTDLILLYYKTTFKSQSGVLNLIAPYKKKILVSDIQSPLSEVVKKFQLSTLVPPDSLGHLIQGIEQSKKSPEVDWSWYSQHASWDHHLSITEEIIRALK